MDALYDICENCGLTLGSHRCDSICLNQCPGHEGRMDWPTSGITVYEPSGDRRVVKRGTPSKRIAELGWD
jgi:hypothetical protein